MSIMGSILSALIPAGFKLCFHFKSMHLDMRAPFILKKGTVMKDIIRRKGKHLRRDLRPDDALCTKNSPCFST
ncbi:hypothetical protein P9F85_04645 [Bacillus stercoris]|uniref:hypothetical protein n=1 Tax=Bacillus stercoris TaxID=2054641 RepID=UPI002DB9238E|nr:hypothetical protein [Bacillus stercoris]MEC2110562.1 hypothetical protein [Bacillus stercoris]